MKTNEHIGSVAWLNARMTLEVLTTARTRIVDDLVSVMLLAAVSNANTSHLDARPDISQRYLAVGSVTDDLRRPAAVSSLAPFSFARCCAPSFIFTKKGLVSVLVIRPTIGSSAMATPPVAVRIASAMHCLRFIVLSPDLFIFYRQGVCPGLGVPA